MAYPALLVATGLIRSDEHEAIARALRNIRRNGVVHTVKAIVMR